MNARMKKSMATRVAVAVVLGLAPHVSALDIKGVTAQPTADNPRYKNKEAWPELAGDEYFLKEACPAARLLIWAHPGVKARRQGPKFTPADPACWVDAATGRPADAIPDMNTDVILPDSDEPYAVHVAQGASFTCRHLTVGRNAQFDSACWVPFFIFGNVWIRPGGKLTPSQLNLMGGYDTFLRQDWPEDGVLKKMHDERTVTPFDPKADIREQPWWNGAITVYMTQDKEPGKSTEVLGYASAMDEVSIKSGTFIVGRGSRFVSLGPSTVRVHKGAGIALLDGAQCSHGINQFGGDWRVDDGGEVTGGTPDRPLRRDAYFGLGYRNWMNLPVERAPNDKKEIPVLPSGAKAYYGYGGYNACISGALTGYPAPGGDARLVVCWQRIAAGGAGAWGRKDEAFKSMFPRIVPKITVWCGPTARIENVRFDDLHRGGIVAPSMEAVDQWKNISFGDACLSKDPKELVRGYEAEIAEMEKGHPLSILEPVAKYTTN